MNQHFVPSRCLAWKCVALVTVCLDGAVASGLAQAAAPVVLKVDIDNFVQYCSDVSDYSKLAATESETSCKLRTFGTVIAVGDIVAVNGTPAKGTLQFAAHSTNLRTAPTLGQAIADTVRNGPSFETLEILREDGTAIGTIISVGAVGGGAPPGSPPDWIAGNLAIVGGTGAFLGARGQRGATASAMAPRNASMGEDPVNRRAYGGGKMTYAYYILPGSRPNIVQTATGPAVVHSTDFAPVTAANPAKAGEILSVFATAMGPTTPGVDPGKPFPASPLALVSSPVEVVVNGTSAEVLAGVGLPSSTDAYQINFRLPTGLTGGMASLQVSAAWIPSALVWIAVQ